MTDAELLREQPTEIIAYFREQLAKRDQHEAELRDVIQKQARTQADLSASVISLNETIEKLRRLIFATKSEKTVTRTDDKGMPHQMCLSDFFDEAEFTADPSVADPDQEEVIHEYVRKKSGKTIRKAKGTHDELWNSLPVHNFYNPSKPEDKICPVCGNEMTHLGWKPVREELEIIPAKVRRVRIMQETFKCIPCSSRLEKDVIVNAKPLPPVLSNSWAAPATIAYVMYQKYINSMPLYRQEKDWTQMGIKVSRTTMANWVIKSAQMYFKPIFDRMHELLLQRPVNCCDETTCQVLREEGRRPQQKSFMWLHSSSCLDGEPPIILFEYEPTRAKYNPQKFYKGYKGYLLSDGYQGYNELSPDIVRCGCLAHLRRYFFDAIPAEERRTGNYRADAGTRFAKAVNYALNQRSVMETYLKDGRIPISNNYVESNCARTYAVGRKNFLFHATVDGAATSAMVYSLAITAKKNNLNVFMYLNAVLQFMPGLVDGSAGIDEMLPWSDKMKKLCAIRPGEQGSGEDN